jgi:hypothetical protein
MALILIKLLLLFPRFDLEKKFSKFIAIKSMYRNLLFRDSSKLHSIWLEIIVEIYISIIYDYFLV